MARLRPYPYWPSPALGNSEIPGQRNWVARLRRRIRRRSVCNSERSAGERGRARGELKTVRPGAATQERFSEGAREKRFGVTAGMACGVGSAHAAAGGLHAGQMASAAKEVLRLVQLRRDRDFQSGSSNH